MKRLVYPFILVIVLSLITFFNGQAQWVNLIKNNLNNWERVGPAKYSLKDGVIIGTTETGPPYYDSFLITKDTTYGNFILELDCWVGDTTLNSGIQIRSKMYTPSSGAIYNQDGPVYGDQIEIDPSSRAWTGGIYDQGRRGWLYPLELNPKAKKAFKVGKWNHFRIEAIGNSIRTWVNGIPCADLVDSKVMSGYIGLQVHSIKNDSAQIGEEVKFKNVRIITKDVQKYATPYKPIIHQESYLVNELSSREKKKGWKLLWDGKTTKGWRGADLTHFPDSGWMIKDGVLSVLPIGDGGESAGGGDIVTDKKYKNFILIVDFKYTKDANSGIKYFVNTGLNKGPGSAIGCEFQILDDRHNPDATDGVAGDRKLGSLYDLIPPHKTMDKGIGAWNRAMIIVNGNHVEQWLNGKMTLEYERNTDMWQALVSKSKYHIWPNFGDNSEGNILLQDHGYKVSFRDIKIKVLK